jgi:hypothetical protein
MSFRIFLDDTSSASRVGWDPTKSVRPKIDIDGTCCRDVFIPNDGLPRIAEGEGVVIFRVGGAVTACPGFPV